MKLVGIDTGVRTGFAVWNTASRSLERVETMPIHRAMFEVLKMRDENPYGLAVYFEDARLRKWFGRKGREALQGAGSVKRDAGIWEDFLRDEGIRGYPVAPKNNATKLSAEAFAGITGWRKRCSEHARDAAMLVFGGSFSDITKSER